jgi:hypothetical protein
VEAGLEGSKCVPLSGAHMDTRHKHNPIHEDDTHNLVTT